MSNQLLNHKIYVFDGLKTDFTQFLSKINLLTTQLPRFPHAGGQWFLSKYDD